MRRLAVSFLALLFAAGCGSAAAFDLLRFPAPASLGAGASLPVAPGAMRAEVNATSLGDAQPGNVVTLAVPSGRSYRFVLERQVVHGTDSASWVGVLEGRSNDYRMTLTYGPEASFGNFATPDGSFRLDTDRGVTWLTDLPASGLSQFTSTGTDARIPPAPNLRANFSSAPPVAEAPPSPQTTIDVLVLYTPGMVTRIGSVAGVITRINFLVTISNQAYIDSDIAITLRLLQATPISGVADNTDNGDELDAITNGTGPYTGVHALRDAAGADMVTLLRPFLIAQVSCGVAWVGGYNSRGSVIVQDEAYGYSVVSDGTDSPYYCIDLTYAHELGHNMGSFHDRVTDAGGYPPYGAYNYSFGYGVNGQFSTVMGYGSSFGAATIGRFSNPNQLCLGFTCGVPSSNPTQSADNVQSINNTRAGVAAWRAAVVRTLPPMAEAQTQSLRVAGGFPITDWYDFAPRAGRSYELQVVNVSTTTNLTAAGSVARFDVIGVNQQQDSSCLDVGCTTRTLRWIAAADTNERVRIANAGTATPTNATYAVQFRETTLYCPRWSEVGGQSSVLVLQRAQAEIAGSCSATAFFLDESGAQVGTQPFSFAPNKVNVQPLSAVGGLPGNKGALRVAHTCGVGGLKAVVTALEPATGFSFGTPCNERSR